MIFSGENRVSLDDADDLFPLSSAGIDKISICRDRLWPVEPGKVTEIPFSRRLGDTFLIALDNAFDPLGQLRSLGDVAFFPKAAPAATRAEQVAGSLRVHGCSSPCGSFALVTVHESRVTSVQKGIELRR